MEISLKSEKLCAAGFVLDDYRLLMQVTNETSADAQIIKCDKNKMSTFHLLNKMMAWYLRRAHSFELRKLSAPCRSLN